MKITLQRSRTSFEILPIITAHRALHVLSKIGAVLLISLLGVAVCAGQNQSPSDQESVAKVARPKTVRKAKVVITNEDLPSRPESTTETSAGSAANSATTAAQKQAAQQSQQNIPLPGLAPGATIDQAREALESLKREERVMVGRYDEIQHKLAETNDQSLRRLYSDSLSRRDETLARKRKQIEEAERAIRLATEAGSTQGGNNVAK
jgi:hypothetical protein